MKIIRRYFSRQLTAIFLVLLLILSGLAWMVQILTMLKFLIAYGINLGDFLYLTSLMFPFIISIILPFVTFIATLFVYNKMVADSEITVMAATGLSPRQMALPALRLAVGAAAVHWILSLAIVPGTQVKFYNTQWEMRYGLAHLKLQESAFTQITGGLVVFVDKVSGLDMSQLMLFDNRNPESQMTVLAERGRLVNTDRGLSIVMANGSVQVKSDTFTAGTFDSYDMDMNVSDKSMDEQFKVRRIPTRELVGYLGGKDGFSEKQHRLLLAETASRFLSPIMNIILVLIGMLSLLKTSLLRRRASFAPLAAVLGMAAAMSAYMTLANSVGSIGGLWMFAAAVIAVPVVLWKILASEKKTRKA
jgi:lipopolysaccharide export system permease protein